MEDLKKKTGNKFQKEVVIGILPPNNREFKK